MIASCSTGRSLCTPLPVSAEIFSTGASPTKYSLRFSSACTCNRCSASSISSHLLSITTIGQPAASTRSARRWSWLVTPSVASITSSAMSAAVDGPQGTHHRVVLGRVVDPAAAAHAGGVDEHDRPVGRLDQRVDGVAGRARHVVHDRAVLADEPVEQRALADVGAADDGDARRRRGRRASTARGESSTIDADLVGCSSSTGGKQGDDLVEQVAGAAAVQRADRIRIAEAERQELPAVVLAAVVVGLVGDQQHGRLDPSQPDGQRLVVVGDARSSASTTNSTTSAVVDGRLDLAADLRVEVVAAGQPAAGVDEQERDAEPLGLGLLAVAGDAGLVLDDGHLLADDAVEQRALADVGAADDRRQTGKRHDVVLERPSAQSEMPSVATTSTGGAGRRR